MFRKRNYYRVDRMAEKVDENIIVLRKGKTFAKFYCPLCEEVFKVRLFKKIEIFGGIFFHRCPNCGCKCCTQDTI